MEESGTQFDSKIPHVLDGTMLKVIAMACMLVDHVGDQLFPELSWMRAIGRLAMPLFAFCIAEGFDHTHNRKRYLKRMLIFAVISEVPFDLCFFGKVGFEHQNIMFTFSLALLALMAFDAIIERVKKPAGPALGAIAVIAFSALGIALRLDYGLSGIGLVFVYHALRRWGQTVRTAAGAAYFALLNNVGYYICGVLASCFILLYNGERGRGLKMLFYIFYPGHLLVLYLIQMLA